MMIGYIIAGFNGNEAKNQVEHDGGGQKQQVDARMTVTPERMPEQWIIAFCNPEKYHTAQQDNHAVAAWNMLPVPDKLFHIANKKIIQDCPSYTRSCAMGFSGRSLNSNS